MTQKKEDTTKNPGKEEEQIVILDYTTYILQQNTLRMGHLSCLACKNNERTLY